MIVDRLKVQVDILMPFREESPAVLNSKFLNKVKIQNLIPQRVKLQDPQQNKSFLKTDFPSQRAFQNSIPLRAKFQYPQWNKASNYQSPSRMKTLVLSSSQDIQIFSSEDLLKAWIPSRLAYNQNSWIPNSGPRTSPYQWSKGSFFPLQRSRIHFPWQQSRFFYLQPSRIHLSSARQLFSITCACIYIHIINIDIAHIASYISRNIVLCFS